MLVSWAQVIWTCMTLQLVIQIPGEVRNTLRAAVRFEIGRWTGAPEAYTPSFSNGSRCAWSPAQNSEQIARIQTGVWQAFCAFFVGVLCINHPPFFGNLWLLIFKFDCLYSKSQRKGRLISFTFADPRFWNTYSFLVHSIQQVVHYDF